ncbi:MAG: ribose 5-phosphate isomerase A [Clostridia bacterium]|nr:ribose 5-phosphate isomerase A [Clostridia bacterium]
MRWVSADGSGYVWQKEITSYEEKSAMGVRAAAMARSGDVIGIGTGSSSYVGLLRLADRVREEGLSITVIPAATEIRLACASLGIPFAPLSALRPDWCFDGADEIGENGDVLKGRGGGLFMEKLIIASCEKRFLLAGKEKFVSKIGACPLPVEVFPEAVKYVEGALWSLGATEVKLRAAAAKDGPAVTEHGNLLIDCKFASYGSGLEHEIKDIPGVIESGLFQDYGFEYILPED